MDSNTGCVVAISGRLRVRVGPIYFATTRMRMLPALISR